MPFRTIISQLLVLGAAAFPAAAAAQAPVTQAPPPPAAGRPAPASDARQALEAGRLQQALELADRTLAARPADEGAAVVKVEALLAMDERAKALDAYETWSARARKEQPALLARLARHELSALARDPLTAVQVRALEALAEAGDTRARTGLAELAWATPPTVRSWPATAALGRLGDAKAAERIQRAVRESQGSGKAQAIEALPPAASAGAEPLLREALGTRDPVLQAAAADAAARLGLKALVPDLQRVAESGEQFGRFAAAVALARLGARGGEALVTGGLESPALDARLLAADARKARGVRGWEQTVRPLLDSPEGLVRFHAAERLLAVDRAAALEVLLDGTTDPNPAIRAEAARILAADPAVEDAQLRRLLRDATARVRLEAAETLAARHEVRTPAPR